MESIQEIHSKSLIYPVGLMKQMKHLQYEKVIKSFINSNQ